MESLLVERRISPCLRKLRRAGGVSLDAVAASAGTSRNAIALGAAVGDLLLVTAGS